MRAHTLHMHTLHMHATHTHTTHAHTRTHNRYGQRPYDNWETNKIDVEGLKLPNTLHTLHTLHMHTHHMHTLHMHTLHMHTHRMHTQHIHSNSYGQRPYDNWETNIIDVEGLEFKTAMAALKSNNERCVCREQRRVCAPAGLRLCVHGEGLNFQTVMAALKSNNER